MRVIAGTLKGRRLDAPDWPGLRPTSDKLRETLFNVVAPRVAGAHVLDGYAGTGAVGIEALSRGAAHVTFVDRDPRAVALIRANLEKCGLAATDGTPDASGRYAIIRAGFGEMAARRPAPRFDLVFLDPPYGASELAAAVAASETLVGDDTLLVVEHAKRDPAPPVAGVLERTRELTSGDSALAFYRRRATTSSVVETA
jgi:16S rRNA (guanine(966)-N(2))-methyltransferase RsmD